MKVPTLEEICLIANRHPKMVHGCYIFGSRVYGTASDESDWDVILIANAPSPEVEYKTERINVHVIVPDVFAKDVRDNHIRTIECLLAPEWAIIKPYINFEDFVFKSKSFRHNISHTVSNSWVKCKKKLEQGDYYIGIKSLFHSLRIADFGIQFAKTRQINFQSSNPLWKELSSKEWTWEELKEKYQPLRNKLLTEFRILSEK
jgi:predicted nucleotidyltransferase